MTNNVRVTLNGSETYTSDIQLVSSKTNIIGDTKYNIFWI